MQRLLSSLNALFVTLVRTVKIPARAEKMTLFSLCLSAIALFAFIEIAEDVVEGDTGSFDAAILLAFHGGNAQLNPIGPPWLEETMRDLTALGSSSILLIIIATTIGFLALTRKWHAAWMVLWSIVSGIVLSLLMKLGFDRPRPDLVPHATAVYTQSFPSGHAMLSAIVYLTLGALLARTQAEVRVKIYLLCVAMLLTVTVGISRVYLGVHWPSDVLAGWAGGAGWALLCWVVMIWLQSKGRIEPPTATSGRSDQSSHIRQ